MKNRPKMVYLLHGRGGSPNGSVQLLQKALEPLFPESSFIRPLLPHSKYDIENPQESVDFLANLDIPNKSLVIGISLGGLVAASLQETSRPDLQVICISSPTRFKKLVLEKHMPNRMVLYSSSDEVIADRVANWPELADAHNLPWLTHDTDIHWKNISREISKGYKAFSVLLK